MSTSINDPLNRGTLIAFGSIMGGMLFFVLLRVACIKYNECIQERDIREYRRAHAMRLTQGVFEVENPIV